MSPSSRWGPPPLLLLVLCWFLVHPTRGFPVGSRTSATRDLAVAASGDDLISGRDFLSVFIGASLGPRSGRVRNLSIRNKVADDPEQSISSFETRSAVKNRNSLQSTYHEPYGETSSRFEDLSDSDSPSVEFISFDSENMDKRPISGSTNHVNNVPNSDAEDKQRGSSENDSRRHGHLGSDTPEYSSTNPTESSTDSSPAVLTESNKTHLSGGDTISRGSTSSVSTEEFIVVTDIVTSKEEVSSTEPILVPETQDASTQFRTGVEFNSNQDKDALQDSKVSQITPKDSRSSGLINVTPSPSVTTYSSVGLASTTYSLFSPSPTESTRLHVSVVPETTAQTPSPSIQQVISVKVSSSVVQGQSAFSFSGRSKNSNRLESGKIKEYRDGLALTPGAPISDEDMQRRIDTDPPASTTQPNVSESESIFESIANPQEGSTALVTEEQPAATAVQRSQFSVDEESPSADAVTISQQIPSIFQHRTAATVVETTRNSPVRPVNYQTSVSTDTSNSRIHFYREPLSYHKDPPSVAESVQTSVIVSHRGSMQANYERISGQPLDTDENIPIESRMGRYGEPHHEVRISGPTDRGSTISASQQVDVQVGRGEKSISSISHEEPVEKNYEVPEHSYGHQERTYVLPEITYGHPERVYGLPEQNYEVDEVVSVTSNGKAHGVQTTTLSPSDANQKIAYVMEGGNYRKYRVEERTSDGFIVGEYGVVSHDDGSLRGVRYTADGTINPRLIQEALVKFLSL